MASGGFQKMVPPADLSGEMALRKTQAAVEPTLRKLYLASTLHGFSDACAKLSTPGFVMEMFGTDFVAASAFFALVNSGQSIAEFLLNPLLGSLSDRFGRTAFLNAWPPVNTVSRMIVVLYPTRGVVLAQQILVKMLEYTFEKAIAATVSDLVDGDRRSVVSGNVSMLKIGLGEFRNTRTHKSTVQRFT
jgi:MFS family permease